MSFWIWHKKMEMLAKFSEVIWRSWVQHICGDSVGRHINVVVKTIEKLTRRGIGCDMNERGNVCFLIPKFNISNMTETPRKTGWYSSQNVVIKTTKMMDLIWMTKHIIATTLHIKKIQTFFIDYTMNSNKLNKNIFRSSTVYVIFMRYNFFFFTKC